MNYKLAKELIDAGFPLPEPPSSGPPERRKLIGKDGVFCRVPTLSELIEACGKTYEEDKGFVLWFSQETYDEDDDMKWHAGYYEFGNHMYIDDYPSPDEEGKTPSEAVARLWLELNK